MGCHLQKKRDPCGQSLGICGVSAPHARPDRVVRPAGEAAEAGGDREQAPAAGGRPAAAAAPEGAGGASAREGAAASRDPGLGRSRGGRKAEVTPTLIPVLTQTLT